jgi:hypothetical protein
MTDIAPRVASKTASLPEPSRAPSPGTLKIYGLQPTKVHVKIFDDDGVQSVGFSSELHGTYYADGVEWEYTFQIEYAKFITFALATNVSRLTCDELSYSDNYDAGPVKQNFCVPPAPSTCPVTYHFFVYPAPNGTNTLPEPIDPQIVVTPIASQ